MYFPNEDIKVNRFRLVVIPSNAAYMQRVGMREPSSSAFSGDDEVHRQQNKVDDIDFYLRYAEMRSKDSGSDE